MRRSQIRINSKNYVKKLKSIDKKYVLLTVPLVFIAIAVWFMYSSINKSKQYLENANESVEQTLISTSKKPPGSAETSQSSGKPGAKKSSNPASNEQSRKILEYINNNLPFSIYYYEGSLVSEVSDEITYLGIYDPVSGLYISLLKSDGYIQHISGTGANSVSCQYNDSTASWAVLSNIPSYTTNCPSSSREVGGHQFYSNIFSSFSEGSDFYQYVKVTSSPSIIFAANKSFNIPNHANLSKSEIDQIINDSYTNSDSALSNFLKINPGLF